MSLLDQSTGTVGMDTSFMKVVTVGATGVLLAGICGYFLNGILNGANNLLPLIFSCIGFFSVFFLQIFYIKSFRYIIAAVSLESVAVALLFLDRFSGSLLLAWFLLLVLWIWAVQRGRTEINNQLQVKFTRVEKFVMPQVFTAIALFISI